MATKYFPQTANAETTCDAGASDHDLSTTQGSSTTQASDAIASETFVEVLTFDLDVSGDSPATGDVNASIDVTDAGGIDYRFRVQAIDDSGCAVDNSTAYSSEFTGTGIKTLAATNLTWAGTSERLRLSIEIKRQTGLHGNKAITLNVQDADTFIEAPWDAPVGGPDIYPDEDISNAGSWAEVGPGTELWEAIDAVIPDVDIYITVTGLDKVCEVGLEGVVDPVSADDHVIHIRGRVIGSTGSIKVELIENTTIRATLSDTFSTSFVDYTYTLSAGEANSITDYDDLRLRLTFTGLAETCRVTQAYFSAASSGVTLEGILPVTGTGAFAALAQATLNADLAVTGTGAFAALAEATLNADLAVTGTATFVALGDTSKLGILAVTGTGAFAALAEATLNADLSVTGTAAFAALAEATLNAELSVTGTAALAALAEATLNADLAVTGTGAFAALADLTHNADLAVTGTAAFAALAEATLNADLAVIGTAAFTADGKGIWTGDLSVTGTGAFAALAEATHNADLSVTGTGAFAALADLTHNAEISVTGTATGVWAGTVVTAADVEGILSVTGIGTAVWVGTVRTPAIMSLTGAAAFAGTPTLAPERVGVCVLGALTSFGATGTGNTLGAWVAPGAASLAASGNVAVVHNAVWS